MAWDVNKLYEFTKFLTNKNLAGGIPATDFFYAWNPEQKSYQEDLLGRWQNRNNGKTGNNTGMVLDETTMQKLSPFTKNTSLTITAAAATKPNDLMYKLALRINGFKVEAINHSQKYSVTNSVIDPPSTTDNKYYYLEYEDYYSFLPSTLPVTGITNAELDYICACEDVKWAYTNDSKGRQIYNPGLSVQPLWDDNSLIEITKRTLKALGVHFKDSDFKEFGNSNIASGN